MNKAIFIGTLSALVIATSALAQTIPNSTQPMPQTVPNTAPTLPSPSTSAVTPAATMPTMLQHQDVTQTLSSKLVGASVYGSTGDRIGDVNDLVIGTDGKIVGLVVGVGGFLGVGEKNVAVSYGSAMMSKDEKGNPKVTVHVTKDELKASAPWVAYKAS